MKKNVETPVGLQMREASGIIDAPTHFIVLEGAQCPNASGFNKSIKKVVNISPFRFINNRQLPYAKDENIMEGFSRRRSKPPEKVKTKYDMIANYSSGKGEKRRNTGEKKTDAKDTQVATGEDSQTYLKDAQTQAWEFYTPTSKSVVPCKPREIEKLEQSIECRLPAAYREFLLWMGRSGGEFLAGSDCFYENLKGLQKDARELLKDNKFPGELPKDAFVFFMHQGYKFYFFRPSEGADPPVYSYSEQIPAMTSFSRLYDHFSNFVLEEMKNHIAIKSEI